MKHFLLVESLQTVLGPTGVTLRIRPQSYQVFSYLLSNENRVVSKDELFDEVWGSVVVSDDSLTQCISDIRKLLGPEHRELLQTIPKKGYRLSSGVDSDGNPIISMTQVKELAASDEINIAETQTYPPTRESSVSTCPIPSEILAPTTGTNTVLEAEFNGTESESRFWPLRRYRLLVGVASVVIGSIFIAALASWTIQLTDRPNTNQPQNYPTFGPSIVVYPFKAINQQKTDYFSDGVSADTVLALNRMSNLRVLPFRTVRDYHTDPQRSQSILKEFAPQYALTGSVWRDANRVRLNIELTDANNGRLLWSERYDEVLEDVFQLQENIARSVATALSVNLTAIETQRAFKIPTENMAAYDYVLIGKSKFRLRNRKDNLNARALFSKAIELDPNYVEAYLGLGETYVEEAMFGYTEWPDDSLAKALDLAQQAVKLDDHNAKALGFLALVYFRLDKFELAKIEVERSLVFNPNDPDLYVLKGLLLSREGQISEAIEILEYARRYDPEIKHGWTELGGLYYLNGDIEKSILTFERGLSQMSHIAYVHIMLAAGYAEAGKTEQAKRSVARTLQILPFFDSQEFSRYSLFRTEEQRSRLLKALAKAGFE